MKIYLLSAVILLQAFSAAGQLLEKHTFHKGEVLADNFTYRFPLFEEATVLFKDGSTAVSKMNFNTLLCQMEFINDKGDTIEVAKPSVIDSIRFRNSTFFFKKIYF